MEDPSNSFFTFEKNLLNRCYILKLHAAKKNSKYLKDYSDKVFDKNHDNLKKKYVTKPYLATSKQT